MDRVSSKQRFKELKVLRPSERETGSDPAYVMRTYYSDCNLLLCLLLSVLHFSISYGECPPILSRSIWEAAPPTAITNMSTPVDYVVIHHTAGLNCQSRTLCSSIIKGYQRDHMTKNPPWNDIGYSYIIGGNGEIYEGRGWDRVGAHAPGYNSRSIGISLTGNFMDTEPTELQLNATKQLIECAISRNKLNPNYKLLGHRQAKTTLCPGNKLYDIIKEWPKWTSSP